MVKNNEYSEILKSHHFIRFDLFNESKVIRDMIDFFKCLLSALKIDDRAVLLKPAQNYCPS